MVLERAEIIVKPGHEDTFDGLRPEIMRLLEACPGCQSAKVLRGIENPASFLFLLEWDSIEAHNAAKPNQNFVQFTQLIAPHGQGGSMIHYAVD